MGRYSLTKLEKRVLKYLVSNGVPFENKIIQKKLRITPETFYYILKKLEERGVIKDYKYAVDFRLLGFGDISWVFTKINRNVSDMQLLIDRLLSFPQVHTACFITGEYDLALKVYTKNSAELTDFLLKLEDDFKYCTNSFNAVHCSKMHKNHNIVLGEREPSKLSKIDLKILDYRMRSPREGIIEVAKNLELHRNTVSKRWNRMLKSGIIMKKSVILSPDYYRKAGVAFIAILLIKTSAGKTELASKALSKLENIHDLGTINFPVDLLAVVRTSSLHEFYEFNQKLLSRKEFSRTICDTTSFVVMDRKSHKRDYIRELGMLE